MLRVVLHPRKRWLVSEHSRLGLAEEEDEREVEEYQNLKLTVLARSLRLVGHQLSKFCLEGRDRRRENKRRGSLLGARQPKGSCVDHAGVWVVGHRQPEAQVTDAGSKWTTVSGEYEATDVACLRGLRKGDAEELVDRAVVHADEHAMIQLDSGSTGSTTCSKGGDGMSRKGVQGNAYGETHRVWSYV